jgi:hypothetical protein
MEDLDSWIHRRLQCFIWQFSKTFHKTRAGLMKRGIKEAPASRNAPRSRGCWSTSNVPLLRRAYPIACSELARVSPSAWQVRQISRAARYGPVLRVVRERGGRDTSPIPIAPHSTACSLTDRLPPRLLLDSGIVPLYQFPAIRNPYMGVGDRFR